MAVSHSIPGFQVIIFSNPSSIMTPQFSCCSRSPARIAGVPTRISHINSTRGIPDRISYLSTVHSGGTWLQPSAANERLLDWPFDDLACCHAAVTSVSSSPCLATITMKAHPMSTADGTIAGDTLGKSACKLTAVLVVENSIAMEPRPSRTPQSRQRHRPLCRSAV